MHQCRHIEEIDRCRGKCACQRQICTYPTFRSLIGLIFSARVLTLIFTLVSRVANIWGEIGWIMTRSFQPHLPAWFLRRDIFADWKFGCCLYRWSCWWSCDQTGQFKDRQVYFGRKGDTNKLIHVLSSAGLAYIRDVEAPSVSACLQMRSGQCCSISFFHWNRSAFVVQG